LSHRSSGTPDTYQLDPLSATTSPYVFIACRITWSAPAKRPMSTPGLSRRRRPIGGAELSLLPAW
jgi:hypothetical protein